MAETDSSNPSMAWDQVGAWMQNCGALGMRMLDRNLRVWSAVSNNLKEEEYSADSMARDFATVVAASMSTMDDVWRYATQPPAREQTARALPNAFLLFRALPGVAGHSLASPVFIDIPFETAHGRAPEDVKIALSGTATDPDDPRDRDGVKALQARIRVRKVSNADQYVLEAVDDQRSSAAGDSDDSSEKENAPLITGVYQGLVYLETPPVALAGLRVVVSEPPVTLSEPKIVRTETPLTAQNQKQPDAANEPAAVELQAPQVSADTAAASGDGAGNSESGSGDQNPA